MSDAILARVAAGDAAAVDECLARYGDLVWSVARRFSVSAADAEDAAQEVFIDLWRSAGRFDPGRSSEATFVTMIARRRLIDRRRKQSRQTPTLPLDNAGDAPAAPVASPVEAREEAAAVRGALARLKPEEQRVLELSIGQGLSQTEISQQTGWPLGSVKTHARRGLLRLRELVTEGREFAKGGAP